MEFVLKHCVRCETVLQAARQHLKPEHFNKAGESIYRVVWEETRKHYDKYQTLPTRDAFAALCKSSLDTTPLPGMAAAREIVEQNADDLIAFFFDDCELAPKVAQDLLREVLLDRVVGDSLRQAMIGNGPRDWTKLIEQQQQSIQAIGGSSARRWQPLIRRRCATAAANFFPASAMAQRKGWVGFGQPSLGHATRRHLAR